MQVNITLYINQLSKSTDSELDAFQIDIFAAVNFLILLFCGLVLGVVVCFWDRSYVLTNLGVGITGMHYRFLFYL